MEKEKIKAEELRLNNLIFDPYDEPTEVDISILDYLRLYSIHRKNGINVGEIKYKPIPLTEEWFIKFGFKIDYESSFTKIYILENDKDCFQYKISKHRGVEFLEYRGVSFRIKSVHQFQNLHFALTQIELTPKE